MASHPVLDELWDHRIVVERHGDKLKMRGPSAPPADLLAKLREAKPELLALLPDADAPRAVVHFRRPSDPADAWATMIGRPGDSREGMVTELLARWTDVEVKP